MISKKQKNATKPKDVLTVATKTTIACTQRCKQMEIINLFGKIDFDPDFDYKTQRNIESSRSCHPREGGDPEKPELQ